jgi:hypothetical protein
MVSGILNVFGTKQTNGANERTPFADPGATWGMLNIWIKDNASGGGGVFIHMGVILILQGSGDA